jgi:hypothetical protein
MGRGKTSDEYKDGVRRDLIRMFALAELMFEDERDMRTWIGSGCTVNPETVLRWQNYADLKDRNANHPTGDARDAVITLGQLIRDDMRAKLHGWEPPQRPEPVEPVQLQMPNAETVELTAVRALMDKLERDDVLKVMTQVVTRLGETEV